MGLTSKQASFIFLPANKRGLIETSPWIYLAIQTGRCVGSLKSLCWSSKRRISGIPFVWQVRAKKHTSVS